MGLPILRHTLKQALRAATAGGLGAVVLLLILPLLFFGFLLIGGWSEGRALDVALSFFGLLSIVTIVVLSAVLAHRWHTSRLLIACFMVV